MREGGAVAGKKYDPLWELVDEKVALQGQEPEVQAHCPHCNVNLTLGPAVVEGTRVACGLCGGASKVVLQNGVATLQAL
jgi:hypothetical protein